MAKEVANEVAGKLRETEIEPMRKEIAELRDCLSEIQSSQQVQVARSNGLLDGLWKVGIVLTTGIATTYYICEMIWHH
jgi:hypothetical protein